MRKHLVLIFAMLLLQAVAVTVFAQNKSKTGDKIYGIVVDSLTQEPLPSATVYINGTTKGTVTDNDGRFELKDVSFPTTVIFSFVGYKPLILDFDRNPGMVSIGLMANIELPEVDVSGKVNKRDNRKDLDYFKRMFLGDDQWGRHAIIKNEEVLIYDRHIETSYEIRRIRRSSYRVSTINMDAMERHEENYDTAIVNKDVFSVSATEPLIIDLPLLGYVLYVDLVKFTAVKEKSMTTCDILGYLYYKPYDNVNKHKSLSYEKNRKKAYWGSSQHFLRSVFENRLKENGYVLTTPEKVKKERKVMWIDKPVDITDYLAEAGDNMMRIYDLKDKSISIRYYQRNDGSPYSCGAKVNGIRRYSESGMTLLKDSCMFLNNGTVMDNNIVFTGELAIKKVAAFLPADYYPPEDTSIINKKESD